MIRLLRTLQYYLTMSLVALWCTLVSIVFYLLSFPFDRHKSLSWAYAKALNFGVRLATRIRVKVFGREHMQPGPAVITMNHQSNFDPLLQGPVFPKNTVIIGKESLLKIPFWGRLFRSTNNILVKRKSKLTSVSESEKVTQHNALGVGEAITRLQNDDCYIWIFPEGTRSLGQGLGQFKRGAFMIAVQAQVPIIPMVSKPMREILHIPSKIARGGEYQIKILPPISTTGLTLDDLPELMERCQALYRSELAKFDA